METPAPVKRRGRLLRLILALATIALPTTASLMVVAPASATGPVFTVMNTSETPPDGVWFRNSPQQNDTNRETGFGVYMNERVEAICYAWGDAVGPYANRVWYYANNVTRPTVNGHANTGYVNTHYVNDGMSANQVAAGIPQCGVTPPPPATDFPVMNTSETLPDGVWFRNSPSVRDTDGVTGHGVYAGDRVHLQCYAFGEAVGAYNDQLWYFVNNLTRPTVPSNGALNQGYLNAHYVNDGKVANVVDDGVPLCAGQPGSAGGSSGGTSGGGEVLGAATGSMPATPDVAPVYKNGQLSEVDGVKLGSARNDWHWYGGCWARDYNTAKDWAIVVKAGSTYHLVRNGMLFGWFDNGGGPGALGCPTSAEGSSITAASTAGTGDSVKVTTTYQQFTGGKLWWVTGMDHAVRVSDHAWQAIGWARSCMITQGCSYVGSDVRVPNYEGYCLGFVYQAYTYGAGVTPVGPAGGTAQAKQWWTSTTVSGKAAGDLRPAPGRYGVWDNARDGHIVLSIGGGYAISTWDGLTHGIHVMKVATGLPGLAYKGSVSPGV
jgi:hypothetical protein